MWQDAPVSRGSWVCASPGEEMHRRGNAETNGGMSSVGDEQAREEFRSAFEAVREQLARVIVGQAKVIEQVVVTMFAGGHALLEGVPGLGKTLLVRTLADLLDMDFGRIQFTPDLMPADIIGTNIVVDDGKGGKRFEFQRGPIFGNIILADEVNRATPKTQSALLEAMQECRVTVSRTNYQLPAPFFVLATQNPIEMEGTYPLPEAQLDRFLLKIDVESPPLDDIVEILNRTTGSEVPRAEKVVDGEAVKRLREQVRAVPISDQVKQYVARLVMASAPSSEEASPLAKKFVRYGSSPRGAQAMVLVGKTYALAEGRPSVGFADVRRAAAPALRHRMILNFEGEAEGVGQDAVIQDILNHVKE